MVSCGVYVSKFIKTGVGDKNEYPLYFEKVIYEVDIDENVEINHNFLNVSAKTYGEVSKFIKTGVGDKNEYPLYFEKAIYEVDIDDNVEINHNFLNVSAKTHGEEQFLLA
uniref:Cadherin domain-containing protein n=1 Tax=Anopheles arabiensis TaxID=7173 RepID=A0A182HI59_ANOAR